MFLQPELAMLPEHIHVEALSPAHDGHWETFQALQSTILQAAASQHAEAMSASSDVIQLQQVYMIASASAALTICCLPPLQSYLHDQRREDCVVVHHHSAATSKTLDDLQLLLLSLLHVDEFLYPPAVYRECSAALKSSRQHPDL
jgi:hypothetical protein